LHLDLELERTLEVPLQHLRQLAQRRLVDRVGAAHQGIGATALLVDQHVQLARHLGQGIQAAVVDHGAQEVATQLGQRLPEQAGDELINLLRRHLGVGRPKQQLRVGRHQRELVEPIGGGLGLVACGFEQRLGVRAGDGCEFGHDVLGVRIKARL